MRHPERRLPGTPEGIGRGPDGLLVAAGTATTVDVLYHLWLLDPRVLDALEAAHSDALDSWPALVDALRTAQVHDAAWEGAVQRIKGYTGEQLLAEALRDQGHVVELAATPNQEGWDALVDGQPVQFKAGLDPGGIEAHLAAHPDIPIVTVAEHAEAYGDVEGVVVLDVSGQTVQDLTRDTLEAAASMPDAVFDLPVITLMVSGGRNTMRALRGHRSPREALVQTVVDTASVGIGAATGGKAGFVIGGGVLGPLGAALGMLAGGLGGTLLGRRVARLRDRRFLRRARRELSRALREFVPAYLEAHRHQVAHLEAQAKRLLESTRWIDHLLPRAGKGYRVALATRLRGRARALRRAGWRLRWQALTSWWRLPHTGGRWRSEFVPLYSPRLLEVEARIRKAELEVAKQMLRLT